jgi:hypothetical protein
MQHTQFSRHTNCFAIAAVVIGGAKSIGGPERPGHDYWRSDLGTLKPDLSLSASVFFSLYWRDVFRFCVLVDQFFPD